MSALVFKGSSLMDVALYDQGSHQNYSLVRMKSQLSVEQTIENPCRFLWSQFWWDVCEILTQGMNMYPLGGSIIFFDWLAESKAILLCFGNEGIEASFSMYSKDLSLTFHRLNFKFQISSLHKKSSKKNYCIANSLNFFVLQGVWSKLDSIFPFEIFHEWS